MMIEFQWDRERHRLTRVPESEVSKEENTRLSKLLRDIQGDNPLAATTAQYEMAKHAYACRDWYQPCRQVPGGMPPVWMHKAESATYNEVRDGLRMIVGKTPQEMIKLSNEHNSVSRAIQFQDYCYRVSTVENYNRGNCQTLLYVHATLKRLNPDGDRAGIELLDMLLQEWYGIFEPETEDRARRAQAHQASKNFGWLSGAWRNVWGSP